MTGFETTDLWYCGRPHPPTKSSFLEMEPLPVNVSPVFSPGLTFLPTKRARDFVPQSCLAEKSQRDGHFIVR